MNRKHNRTKRSEYVRVTIGDRGTKSFKFRGIKKWMEESHSLAIISA